MYHALPKTIYYLIFLIAFICKFVTTQSTHTNLPTSVDDSAHIVPRWFEEIHCEWLQPAITDPHICYLGYQAVNRIGDVNVDLSVWDQNCKKVGCATFVPLGKKYNLNSELKYVVVTKVRKAKFWYSPPSLDYAGKQFDGSWLNKPALRYNCYYPHENDPNFAPELQKETIFCFVPFEC